MKKIEKKLQLNKTTISSLNNQQLNQVRGGIEPVLFDTQWDYCITTDGGGIDTGGGGDLARTISCLTCAFDNATCQLGATKCGLANTCSCESRCLCFVTVNQTNCNLCPTKDVYNCGICTGNVYPTCSPSCVGC